jgi:hypothetical protein
MSMTMINRFESTEEFLAFRDHVKTVMADKMKLNLKPRKVDELAAILAGATDFNTAIGLCKQKTNNNPNAFELNGREFDLEIPSIVRNKKTGGQVKFDAVGFFEDRLDAHTLPATIAQFYFKTPNIAVVAAATLDAKNEDLVYSKHHGLKDFQNSDGQIDKEALHDWLINRGFTVLASFLDYLEMRTSDESVRSFKEFVADFEHLLWHSHEYEADIGSFKYVMGTDFDIKGSRGAYHWSYRGENGSDGFSTKMGAIEDFLDTLDLE